MKKICILQNSLSYGGTDTFVINLCTGLVRDGYDVTVVLSVDKEETLPREGELCATGVTILKTCHLRGVWSKLKHLKQLFQHLRSGEYDVFQTNIDLFNGPQMLVAWLAGVPIRECHSHNSEQSRERKEGRKFTVKLYQALMRWLCWTFSNRRGGCSEKAMDFLFGGHWRQDSHSKVIHNGIHLQEYEKPKDTQEIKEKLGFSQMYNICTIGRMDIQKNPIFITEIIKELSQIRSDCDLIWVGIGEMREAVQKNIAKFGIGDMVHLLGTRRDIPEILKSCDLFLLPSLFEGLGIVLIEAQAAGLTCVTSDTIPPEANCGGCLCLSLEQNAHFWAEYISKVLDGKVLCTIDRMQLNAYSVEHMVKEMEALLKG